MRFRWAKGFIQGHGKPAPAIKNPRYREHCEVCALASELVDERGQVNNALSALDRFAEELGDHKQPPWIIDEVDEISCILDPPDNQNDPRISGAMRALKRHGPSNP